MFALESRQGICLLEFSDREELERQVQSILVKTKGRLKASQNEFSHQLSKELKAYFEDASSRFTVPLEMIGSEFQKLVWKELTTIPAGTTHTYSQVAEMIGKPQAARAVGHANARNPIAIVIPCHRLIGASGNLTGYGGGIWRKEWLLQHEQEMGISDRI
jgi:AraC family transcriptional regulator of adaptative response/methylated-DNA-[protein]-cysteine methyltransferase